MRQTTSEPLITLEANNQGDDLNLTLKEKIIFKIWVAL
jgi:hypothetical protein